MIFFTAALFLKDQFIFHPQELALWEILAPAMETSLGFKDFLSHAPLAYLNFLGPLMKLLFGGTIFLPHFLILSVFIFILFLESEKTPANFLRYATATACLFHPEALRAIATHPLQIFIVIFLWTFVRGLVIANSGNLGRGVLLMGFSGAILLLSGAMGIAFALSLFALTPLLIRGPVFRESVSGGFLVLMFPGIAAVLGLSYLAWLSEKNVSDLAFLPGSTITVFPEFQTWIPFVFPAGVLILQSKLGPRGKILSVKTIITGILAALIASTLKKEIALPAVAGLTAIGLAFEFMAKKRVGIREASAGFVFLILAWTLGNPAPLLPVISQERWNGVNSWITAPTRGGVMLAVKDHALLTLGVQNRSKLLTPRQEDFKQRMILGNFTGIGRLVIERPPGDEQRLKNQDIFFQNPPPGMKLVYDDGMYRIFDRAPELTDLKPDPGKLSQGMETPYRPILEALTGILFLIIYIVLRKRLNRTSGEMS